MKLALLGGVNHQWVYLMNGACVTELAGCINDAGPTEVAVTPDCYNHALACIEQSSDPALNVTLDVNQLKSRNYLVQGIKYKSAERAFRSARSRRMSILKHDNSRYISLDKSNEQALIESAALFVPRPILTAVYSESLDHIAELRQVTTMFLSLDSYSPSLHQDPATLQGFFFAAQQVLFESGGFLRQFLVDDKGCVLIAMWGMPSFTYSNNCSRALFTAVMILNQSKELGHKCSAGVTTGTVFCGSVGAPERRDYAAIGNEVNMAARLMGKAKGRVLIDNNTYQNLNGATRNKLHAAEEMKLKGNDTPVKPYEYTDLGEIPRITQDDEQAKYATILRRQVKAILMDQLDRLANSKQYSDDDQKTSFSIILGLPGTGKSTAAEYFRRGARRRNLQCVFIQARPGHDGVPYGLMRELFLEVVGEDNFQTEAQQRAVIGDLINQAYSDDYERLNAKLSVELVLGVEWSEVYNRFDASDYSTMLKSEKVSSPKSAFASVYSDEEEFSSGMKESYSTKNDPYTDSRSALKRRTGDLAFYKILCVLLKNTPTAIIFEDAHFCDELSWNEMHLLLIGNEISLAILLTMRSSTSVKFPSSSNGDGNPFQSTEKASTPVSGNRRQSILTSNNGRSNSMLGSSSMDNQDNPGIFSHASKYGLRFQSCPAYMSIMGHDNSCVIEMTGLNEEEVTDVLIRTLEVSTVSSDLVKLVLDVSSGNAFWCKAIAKFIHERGVKELEKAIEQGDSRQDSLKVLIVCRMEKLSVEEQLVLKHASILGDEFSETMLTAVLPSKLHSNLSQSLEQLAEHGFILCIEEHPVAIFVFQNQLIQRTLYSLMPPR